MQPIAFLHWISLAVVFTASLGYGTAAAEIRSVTDIEASLNPLEFIANHDGVRRSMDLDIAFDFNSATLLPRGQEQVAALAEAMRGSRLASLHFQVIGHTDAVGDPDYNLALSQRRASAVVDSLVNDHGIDPSRLVPEGRGESELKPGYPPDADLHRRVEIVASTDSPAVSDSASSTDDGVHSHDSANEQAEKTGDGEIRIEW